MRLLSLRDDGEFSLDEFLGNNIPAYAILSHTWGSKDDEVTYQDLQQNVGKEKIGYGKMSFCGKQAAKDGLRYFWIDTCCIDKTSSAELSEALTSMFRWYQNSTCCYAYLSDVSMSTCKGDQDIFRDMWISSFRSSRWFTRGWTLQELVAPRRIVFFSKEGERLGDRLSLEQTIHNVTRIPLPALRNCLDEFDVEKRLTWMQCRQTTREEDRAYSMSGILGVSMLPMYGEGQEMAFKRLRREVKELRGPKSSSLTEEQKQELLASLSFDQIDARKMTIKNAHANTCEWLLENRQYLDWLDVSKLREHHGFLWIKGKAGAGKSTLMKYILEAREQMENQATLSFFFNARGTDLERSTVGAYRSLLLQLLEQFPTLNVFDSLGLSASTFRIALRWNVDLLKILFERALQTIPGSNLVFFVDALDECEEDEVRDMVHFFERLGDLALSANLCFNVCFASRHYPHITIRKGLELVLEKEQGHAQDIANYIETELQIGQSKVAQQIRQEEWDRGQVHTLRRKLREIPGDSHALFRDILTRDSYNKASLILCIQWILFAKEPLSPEQLYHAILSGVDSSAVTAWDSEEITEDVLRRFILDCSKGLAEITVSHVKKVQFIHESIRDFLLKENGLGKIWPELESNFIGQSHERLKQCCSTYSRLEPAAPEQLLQFARFTEEHPRQAEDWLLIAQRILPFLCYAIRNVLYHADVAAGSEISQRHFLDHFPSPLWVRQINVLGTENFSGYSEQVSASYLLAEQNLTHLLQSVLTASKSFEIGHERYGCPLYAAAATCSEEALAVCMKHLGTVKLASSSSPVVHELNPEQEAMTRATRRSFTWSRQKGLLLSAAELGLDAAIVYLIDLKDYAIDSRDLRDRPALWWASMHGCDSAVRALLGAGSELVNHSDRKDRTPLLMAAEWGHDSVVQILLDNGADPDIQDRRQRNALQAAAGRGYEQIVAMLLKAGANVNLQGYNGVTPLRSASCYGYEEIVKMLLDAGADANLERGTNLPPLMGASRYGHASIVKMLLNAGADVRVQDDLGVSPLSHAVTTLDNIKRAKLDGMDKQKTIIKLLLDSGADANFQAEGYDTLL